MVRACGAWIPMPPGSAEAGVGRRGSQKAGSAEGVGVIWSEGRIPIRPGRSDRK